jgi:hypothetical protein
MGESHVHDVAGAEWAVAYDDGMVRTLFARCGLAIEAVHFGTWSADGRQSQDLVIATVA